MSKLFLLPPGEGAPFDRLRTGCGRMRVRCPALIALLKDQQPTMRQLAAWSLYQIEDPAAAPALQAALNAESVAELKLNYIQALAALGEKSVDAVRGLLLSTDPKIKQMAVRALAGGKGAGPWPWPWPEPRPYP